MPSGKSRWNSGSDRGNERSSRCETSIPALSPSRATRRHAIHIVGVGDNRIGTVWITCRGNLTDIPHIPSKFVEIVPLSHRQGNCIPYAAIRWHDFGNRPALGRPLGHFSRHPDTPLLSLSPRRRFPRPTPERVFVADHQSLPIRLTPMTATCRVPPLSRVKLGIGWSRGVARDAEQ